ncbi:MAG TPA: pyridoxal-dependent decarboxylase [Acidimicrobiales bacterium]|nr:pyridoxal-dependent decarboxylase [Acidimicrobiales bacterium]
MSDSTDWRNLVVTLDDRGVERLTDAAVAAVHSLHVPPATRSPLSPAELHSLITAIEICPENGVGLHEVLKELGENLWSHGVQPSNPATVAHLHPPTLLPAVVTDLSIAATNQSMDSWDQAPAATELELHLMTWLAQLAGLPDTGSGVMTSGGTASNMLAITLARSAASAMIGVDVLKTGLPDEARRWRIVCSDQAHFSVQRAAAQLGLGRDAVVSVPSTPTGEMDIDALDVVLAVLATDDLQVLAVVATAGTTDLGAIDPLDAVAERARRVGAWYHVDAAVGGAFLLSDRLRPRLRGLELADSITVDFHKLWWQPFNASALIVRDVERFELLRVRSNYLDRGDELEGMVNLVGRSLDTSRRFDAAKVVATLRAVGSTSLAAMLEYLVDLTRYAGSLIESQPALELVAAPSTVMCVFRVKGASDDEIRRIQQRLLARGDMVLGRTDIEGRAALKFTFVNPLATRDDVERLVELVLGEFHELHESTDAEACIDN